MTDMADDARVDHDAQAGRVNGAERSVRDLAALIDSRTTPTPEQEAIIGAGLEPTLVVAGAGSGKTETLSMRMAYLLDHGARLFGRDLAPDEILCLTFTRKAAAEIAERAEARLDAVFGEDPSRPPVSVATYNGYAASLVAEHGLRLGIDPDVATLTDAALWQIADDIVQHWSEPVETQASVSTLTQAVMRLAGQTREHLTDPAAVAEWARRVLSSLDGLPGARGGTALVNANGNPTPEAASLKQLVTVQDLAPMVERYLARKRDGSYLDFADQVAYGVALADLDAVQAIERARYRVVLLDEFQDTSPAQLRLFAAMFGPGHPVMAVGDPNQAIYGFRGASASALSSFVTEFGGPARVISRTLSVSWRNEATVLRAANAVAGALPAHPSVHVEPLRSTGQYLGRAEPARVAPGLLAHMATDLVSEADAVAGFIAARRLELGPGKDGAPASAAVLCRRRAQFPAMVEALERAGLDYEVVGLGGLLDTPEVAELIALLQVAHDPSRGDSLMRLLAGERLALGPADLMALKDWSDRDRDARDRADSDARHEAATIVDGVDRLPAPGWVSREGRSLTAEAHARLAVLRHVIRAVRERTYLSLTELIAFAERAWGLDIEAEVARPDGRAVRNVDAFLDAARSFAAGAERATLGAFLAWLEAARSEERGLSAPVKEPEPGAVQILTCHSAKGLEWDIVAIPGMTQGARSSQFPSLDSLPKETPEGLAVNDSGWMNEAGALPYPLRLDRDDLPWWDLGDVEDRASLGASIAGFKAEAGLHRLEEERRLFYVALTRARSHVLLSGSWWGTSTSVLAPSVFLQDLVDRGTVTAAGWAPRPDDEADKPEAPLASALWPPAPTAEQERRRALAADVAAASAALDTQSPPSWHQLPWGREIEAMLRERDQRSRDVGAVALPGHLTTSQLVWLQRDREGFAEQLRRPLPQEPTLASARGTALHGWIEAHYGHPSLLTAEDLASEDALGADVLAADDVARLRETFARSEWAERLPSDIEVRVELPVAGVTIRSRIDAVFPAGAGLERVTVVDWKSGRPPRDDAERAAREVQLAVYRLAWSEWKGIPLEEVDAAFYYVGADQTVWPERLMTRQEIVGLLRGES
ncbi:ATP-dependent DNA helicase [Demequina sp. NBRC 110055]|uniref:ATP-dependent DNA helicase n=1 Tax=Demequina sp. NBRC 110055 TaxID=1570344 RepID=UPI001F2105AB|nr:ATP-dependent DNA helicase [Demequina sp. NBRC 110055]